MKKIVSLLCAALCLTLLLAACGAKVPEGMEEEKVKAAAEATVKQLDARDYEALMDTMDDTLKGAMTAEEWAATWQPAADQLGALVEIEKHSLVAKDGYAVDVAQAKFENGSLTFTLSYTTDYQLAGLFMK